MVKWVEGGLSQLKNILWTDFCVNHGFIDLWAPRRKKRFMLITVYTDTYAVINEPPCTSLGKSV